MKQLNIQPFDTSFLGCDCEHIALLCLSSAQSLCAELCLDWLLTIHTLYSLCCAVLTDCSQHNLVFIVLCCFDWLLTTDTLYSLCCTVLTDCSQHNLVFIVLCCFDWLLTTHTLYCAVLCFDWLLTIHTLISLCCVLTDCSQHTPCIHCAVFWLTAHNTHLVFIVLCFDWLFTTHTLYSLCCVLTDGSQHTPCIHCAVFWLTAHNTHLVFIAGKTRGIERDTSPDVVAVLDELQDILHTGDRLLPQPHHLHLLFMVF